MAKNEIAVLNTPSSIPSMAKEYRSYAERGTLYLEKVSKELPETVVRLAPTKHGSKVLADLHKSVMRTKRGIERAMDKAETLTVAQTTNFRDLTPEERSTVQSLCDKWANGVIDSASLIEGTKKVAKAALIRADDEK